MANSNVPATPSQEELREKENIKNVKNSEERETDNLNSNIDFESLPMPTMSSTSEAVNGEAGSSSVTKPSKVTKIPGPVALGPSASTFQMSNRKYTSILDMSKGRQQSANDSGIQMDSSLSDVEASPLSALPSPVTSYRSEMDLQLAEQQTLKELQRVVAEMEAQVALDDEEEQVEAEPEGLQNGSQLDASKAQQEPQAKEPVQEQASGEVQINEEMSGLNDDQLAPAKAQLEPLADEVKQESAQKPASDEAQINEENSGQKEDPPAALEAKQEPLRNEPGQDSAQKPTPDNVKITEENLGLTEDQPVAPKAQEEEPEQKAASNETQINKEKSEQKEDPLEGQGTTHNEVLPDNQMLKKKTQKEEPEPVNELSPDSDHKFPQIVVQEPSVGSVEVQIQQAFENVNQSQVQVPLEEPVGALNGGSDTEYERFLREQFEKPEANNQNLFGEAQPEEVADTLLSTTSEAGLIAQPSQTGSHLDGSVAGDRRMVRLEELLGNANNVDLLRRLLQIGAEGNLIDSEPDFGTQESSGEDKDTEAETESGPGTSTPTGTGTGTEASTDEDAEAIDDEEDDDESEVSSDGLNKATYSLIRRLFSGKLVNLACPILFCGLAAGLIYLSRKA